MRALTIQTPSRLHFGLLGWGPRALRQFGGFGLMIDDPGLVLQVEPAETWISSGPHAERALELGRALARKLEARGATVEPARITIERAPRAHVGLGVGTQLSLALARVLCESAGVAPPSLADLAALTGRGQRSGIGLHGFERGGFLVDGGRGAGSETPPLLFHHPFPADWRVLVATPAAPAGLHGDEESRAFRHLAEWPEASTERLCRLVLLGIMPALLAHDLPGFGAALRAIQCEVGRGFALLQGGTFAHPGTDALFAGLAEAGVVGLGQSSWGPTVYGFAPSELAARLDLSRIIAGCCPGQSVDAFWTRACPTGARLSTRV